MDGEQDAKTLNELLSPDSTLNDLSKLIDQDFAITNDGMRLVYAIAEKQREKNKHQQYDFSVYGTIYMSFLVSELKKADIPQEEINYIKSSIKPMQSLLANMHKGDMGEYLHPVSEQLGNLRVSGRLDDIFSTVEDSFKHVSGESDDYAFSRLEKDDHDPEILAKTTNFKYAISYVKMVFHSILKNTNQV